MKKNEETNLLQRIRRKARKEDLYILKSRGATNIDNYGGYRIYDMNNYIIAGEKFDISLEELAKEFEL